MKIGANGRLSRRRSSRLRSFLLQTSCVTTAQAYDNIYIILRYAGDGGGYDKFLAYKLISRRDFHAFVHYRSVSPEAKGPNSGELILKNTATDSNHNRWSRENRDNHIFSWEIQFFKIVRNKKIIFTFLNCS